ncbi:MAG: DUF4160 domain-containing protein [Pseudomonadota bacterium]|nr:DUF4160 domain-containing protein [Pseudomonadota bacterium]
MYFYSLDCAEPRHVHAQRERRVCKFWLDPVALADNHGFNAVELRLISKLVREHRVRIVEGWNEHCGDD